MQAELGQIAEEKVYLASLNSIRDPQHVFRILTETKSSRGGGWAFNHLNLIVFYLWKCDTELIYFPSSDSN